MKILHLSIIVTLFTCVIFLIIPHDAYASTCAYRETIYSAPQFFLLSDNVFVGTVTSISNYSDHQWQIHFNIEKIWKGVATRQTSTAMTGTLQACSYSITVGGKYLVYTNGSPFFINTIFSKPYADIQNETTLFDDPNFQVEEESKSELNKKLEAAKGRVESMMIDKTSHMPINGVGVDQINSTLDINIDNTKTSLSAEEYQKRLTEILGNIPIKITFGQYTAAAPIIENIVTDNGDTTTHPLIHGVNSTNALQSPLKQLQSGTKAEDVICKSNFQLIINHRTGNVACVKPQTGQILVERGWATLIITMPLGGQQTSENIRWTKDRLLSENDCGQFFTAPGIHDSNAVPVLLMNSNSTGCARLTYDIIYKYDSVSNGADWPRLVNFTSFSGLIGNYHYSKIGDGFSLSSGKDYTSSFQVTVMPQIVDLANYPLGSHFTVTYIIKPLPNATGFYDHSIPRLACERYPLSVGYSANQVNYSDFSYIYPLNPPCGSAPYDLTAVEISGMDYKQVALGPHP